MKKTICTCLVALFTLAFCTNKVHAQTLATPNLLGGCYSNGDSILVNTLGTATGSETLKTYFGDGTSAVTPVSFFSGGTDYFEYTHNYVSSGSYTVKFVLISGGVDIDSITLTNNFQKCQALGMGVYNDVNHNCILDTADLSFYLDPATIEIDSAGHPVDTVTTLWQIDYLALGPVGTIYTFRIIHDPYGFTPSCPASDTVNDTVNYSGYVLHNIGFVCDAADSVDNAVFADASDMAVHNGWQWAEVTTTSCTSIPLTLTITYSPKYSVASVTGWSGSGATYSVAGNIITVNFPSVSATTPTGVDINYNAVGSLSIGDTIHSMFYVTPIIGDPNPANNTETFIDSIRTSYDPNDKSVQPQGNITAGTNLQYMLSFENTGNDTAFNINIVDTLSDNLDIKTIQLNASSAKVYMTLLTYSGQNVVQFTFPNINLLDSSHHGQCEGFVDFTINSKTGLATGTKIDNSAGIYFDDNPVVMTNNVENIIGTPTAVSVISNVTKVEAYPNPVSDELTIKVDNGTYNTMRITNTIGQVVIEQHFSGVQAQVSVKTLPPGIYYVTLRGDSGIKVLEFEKI